jgi:hypothetical protein
MNFFMPTSYYDGETNSSSQEQKVLNRAFIQNMFVENDKLQREFFSPNSAILSGQRTPLPRIFLVVMKKMLTLSDAQFDKINRIAAKTNGLPPPKESTNIRLVKLLLAGDISGFVNSFSEDENINEDVIVSKAQQFSGPDIVVYRQAIDIVLNDPLLTDPRATNSAEIGTMIKNNLIVLKNLNDNQLTTFMYLVENRLTNPDKIIQVISDPNFSPFLDKVYEKLKTQGSVSQLELESIYRTLPTKSTKEQQQVSTMIKKAIQSTSSMPVIQTVIKKITSSSSRVPVRPKVAKPVSSPTSYRPKVAKPPDKCRPPGSLKFWLKKC